MNAKRLARRATVLAARTLRPALPLELRKRIVARALGRGVPGQPLLAVELLRDLAHDDRVAFHHFLWENHLAYAESYDVSRFAVGEVEADRRLLFELIRSELRRQGLGAAGDVHSVLDAGCSLGYVLRYAETQVFTTADELLGFDIDGQAVTEGNANLRRLGSRARLVRGGMEDADDLLHGRTFDVVLCCGALMYLDERSAASAVVTMLRHANLALGLIDRAHPVRDNSGLAASTTRALDETLIHNLDRMVEAAGGTVVERRWEPPAAHSDRGVYVLVAVPRETPQRA